LDAKKQVAALGLFLLAVYSKISAVPLAPFTFLVFYCLRRDGWKRSAMQTAGFAVAALGFMAHHHLVIGRTSQMAPLSGSYGQTLFDMLPVGLMHARLLWGVPPFCVDYDYLKGGHAFWSLPVLAGLALLIAVVAGTCWALRHQRLGLIGMGFAWFLLFMAPVSNLMPMMQYLAERFLYLPLVGWLWVLGAGALLLEAQRKWIAVAGVTLLVFWAALAFDRARIWRDEVSLFVTSVVEGPRSKRLEDNAVGAVLRLPHMQRVFHVQRVPGKEPIVTLAAGQQVDWPAVMRTLEELGRLLPDHPSVASARGVAWALQGKPQQAIPFLEAAATRRPSDPGHWTNLGQALVDAGQTDAGVAAFARALQLAPNNLNALRSLSAIFWKQQQYQEALRHLEKLKALEPQNPDHEHWIQEARKQLGNPKLETREPRE
jgi:hypothetical protein